MEEYKGTKLITIPTKAKMVSEDGYIAPIWNSFLFEIFKRTRKLAAFTREEVKTLQEISIAELQAGLNNEIPLSTDLANRLNALEQEPIN